MFPRITLWLECKYMSSKNIYTDFPGDDLWRKCSPCRYAILSSNFKHSAKGGYSVCSFTLQAGRQRQGEPEKVTSQLSWLPKE